MVFHALWLDSAAQSELSFRSAQLLSFCSPQAGPTANSRVRPPRRRQYTQRRRRKVINANANNSISLLIRRSFLWITLAADKRPSATCLTIVPFSLRSRPQRNLQPQHHNRVVKTGLWRAGFSVLTRRIFRHHVATCDTVVYSILRRLCAPAPFRALDSNHQSGTVSHL